jgi:hypothetical protein
MSDSLKILIVLSFLFITSGLAQEVKITGKDTLKNKTSLPAGNPFNQHSKAKLNLLENKLSFDEIHKIYLPDDKGILNNKIYTELNFGNLSVSPYRGAKYGFVDSTGYFNKNLSGMLALNYKELTKYDLGAFGEYLGISNGVLAIILAVLSVTK